MNLKILKIVLLAFYCYTGEIVQTGDTVARLMQKDCYPYYKYGERYYNEHWLYKGKNAFTYEVIIKRGEVTRIKNSEVK